MKIEQILPKKLTEAPWSDDKSLDLNFRKPRSEFTKEELYQDLRQRYGWDDETIAARLEEFPNMFNQDWGVPRSDPALGGDVGETPAFLNWDESPLNPMNQSPSDEQTTNQGINILGGEPEGIEIEDPDDVDTGVWGQQYVQSQERPGDSATDDETSADDTVGSNLDAVTDLIKLGHKPRVDMPTFYHEVDTFQDMPGISGTGNQEVTAVDTDYPGSAEDDFGDEYADTPTNREKVEKLVDLPNTPPPGTKVADLPNTPPPGYATPRPGPRPGTGEHGPANRYAPKQVAAGTGEHGPANRYAPKQNYATGDPLLQSGGEFDRKHDGDPFLQNLIRNAGIKPRNSMAPPRKNPFRGMVGTPKKGDDNQEWYNKGDIPAKKRWEDSMKQAGGTIGGGKAGSTIGGGKFDQQHDKQGKAGNLLKWMKKNASKPKAFDQDMVNK